MPLNNFFYGVYKFAVIRTTRNSVSDKYPYIIESLNVNDTMAASAKFFMQGTPQTKILDIGNVKEEFRIKAPILVTSDSQSNGDLLDGLQLMWDMVSQQYTATGLPNNALPLMSKCDVSITSDLSEVNITLLSDGDPNNSVNVYEISSGATAQGYISTTGIANAARVAKNYDFFMNFGGLKCFVKNATLSIDIKSSEHSFLGVYNSGTIAGDYSVPQDGLNNGVFVPFPCDRTYSGWQFPFIAVGGIEITVTGKAVVSIDDDGNAINYQNNTTTTSDVDTLLSRSNVTLQKSGELTTTTDNFDIFFSGRGTTYDPDALSGVLPPLFRLNKGVITAKNYSFSANEMTTDFTAKIYVGVP